MKALYEIAADLRAITDAIEAADGEITPDLEAALDAIAGDFAAKVEGVCRFRANLAAEHAMFKSEADTLAARAKSIDRKMLWLENYLLREVLASGQNSVKAGLFTVTLVKNSRPSITPLVPVETLPEELQRVKIEFNGTAAYESWKAGQKLPAGLQVVEGVHLQVRPGKQKVEKATA